MNLNKDGKTIKFELGNLNVPLTRPTAHPAIKLNRQGCYYAYAYSPDLDKAHIGYWPTYASALAAFTRAEQMLKDYCAKNVPAEPDPF